MLMVLGLAPPCASLSVIGAGESRWSDDSALLALVLVSALHPALLRTLMATYDGWNELRRDQSSIEIRVRRSISTNSSQGTIDDYLGRASLGPWLNWVDMGVLDSCVRIATLLLRLNTDLTRVTHL